MIWFFGIYVVRDFRPLAENVRDHCLIDYWNPSSVITAD
jgi:hypothetical protein